MQAVGPKACDNSHDLSGDPPTRTSPHGVHTLPRHADGLGQRTRRLTKGLVTLLSQQEVWRGGNPGLRPHQAAPVPSSGSSTPLTSCASEACRRKSIRH